jgi:hypothetical protein
LYPSCAAFDLLFHLDDPFIGRVEHESTGDLIEGVMEVALFLKNTGTAKIIRHPFCNAADADLFVELLFLFLFPLECKDLFLLYKRTLRCVSLL